jgi:hypothetical protein
MDEIGLLCSISKCGLDSGLGSLCDFGLSFFLFSFVGSSSDGAEFCLDYISSPRGFYFCVFLTLGDDFDFRSGTFGSALSFDSLEPLLIVSARSKKSKWRSAKKKNYKHK